MPWLPWPITSGKSLEMRSDPKLPEVMVGMDLEELSPFKDGHLSEHRVGLQVGVSQLQGASRTLIQVTEKEYTINHQDRKDKKSSQRVSVY